MALGPQVENLSEPWIDEGEDMSVTGFFFFVVFFFTNSMWSSNSEVLEIGPHSSSEGPGFETLFWEPSISKRVIVAQVK